MSYYEPRLWTLEEISILRSYYGHVSNKEIQNKLFAVKSDYPRTISSIMNRAYKLGFTKKVSHNTWSVLEIDYLKSNYKTKPLSLIAKELKRSDGSVYNAFRRYYPDLKLCNLGNKINTKSFNEFEINFLKENSHLTHNALGKYLNRHRSSIQFKLKELKLDNPRRYKKFSKKEINYLKNNLNLSHGVLAKHLKRSARTVTNKLISLGLYERRERIKRIADWTESEILKVKELHTNNVSYKEISKILNKTYHQVTYIIRKMGLSNYTYWTKEDDEVLLKLHGTHTHTYISKIVNKSISGVCKRYKLLQSKVRI